MTTDEIMALADVYAGAAYSRLPHETSARAALQSAIEAIQADAARYYELIYAVGNKYPDETRHETALRYMRQAETSTDSWRAAMALDKG